MVCQVNKHFIMFNNRPFDSFINQHDDTQVALLNEPCILVDSNDKVVGKASKKECHLLENIHGKNMLHRAFSVFIFNKNKELLMTQRSSYKILFPNHWTNACCSHPLYTESELDINNDYMGVVRAAKRRTEYELGIKKSEMSLDKFQYITRISYHADNSPHDGIFGEHEIDYCLILKGDFKMEPKLNEVKDSRFVNVEQLREMLELGKDPKSGVLITPWFRMICENFLFYWWQNLNNVISLKDHDNIHK